jgi:hypothetical protein
VTATEDQADPPPAANLEQDALAAAQDALAAADALLWREPPTCGPAEADEVLTRTCAMLRIVTSMVLWLAGPGAEPEAVPRRVTAGLIAEHLDAALTSLANLHDPAARHNTWPTTPDSGDTAA